MFQFTEPNCTINKSTSEDNLCNLMSALLLNVVYLISHLKQELQFVAATSALPTTLWGNTDAWPVLTACLWAGSVASLAGYTPAQLRNRYLPLWRQVAFLHSCCKSKRESEKEIVAAAWLKQIMFVQWPDSRDTMWLATHLCLNPPLPWHPDDHCLRRSPHPHFMVLNHEYTLLY